MNSEIAKILDSYDKYLLKDISIYLRKLGLGEIPPKVLWHGICPQLGLEFDMYGEKLIEPIAAYWPKYSGESRFPVPHPTMAAEDAYHDLNNLWLNTQYGNDRRELCIFLAGTIDEYLSNSSVASQGNV